MFVDNDFWVSKKFKMALKTYDNNFKNEMGSRNNKFYNEIQKSTLIFFILGGAVVAAIVALQ